MPPIDWTPLLNLPERELSGNLEMAERESAAFGLLMWAMGHPQAISQLEIALNERFPRTSVHAAMAQLQ